MFDDHSIRAARGLLLELAGTAVGNKRWVQRGQAAQLSGLRKRQIKVLGNGLADRVRRGIRGDDRWPL